MALSVVVLLMETAALNTVPVVSLRVLPSVV
jgi:hypothetical protein